MAQLEGMQHHGDSSRTIEQFFNIDSPSAWKVPRTLEGMLRDEDNIHHSRKISVIAKVKEKAKKWRQIISRKRHGHDNLPPWSIDDEMEVDPKHHGGSNVRQHLFGLSSKRSGRYNMKKSATVANLPKSYSYNQRGNTSFPKNTINYSFQSKSLNRSHHGRALSPINSRIEHTVAERNIGVLGEKLLHLQATRRSEPVEVEEHPSDITPLSLDLNDKSFILEQKSMLPVTGSMTRIRNHIDRIPVNEQEGKLPILEKTTNETRADKSTVNDLKVKLPSLIIPTESEQAEKHRNAPRKSDQEKEKLPKTENTQRDICGEKQVSPTTVKTVTGRLGPTYVSVSQDMSMPSAQGTVEEQNYGRSISVKEYLRNKLEPGEDERALSQVISEVISPRKTPCEKGVVEKMREAVSLMLQSEEESPSSSSLKKSESPSSIPVSSNAHEGINLSISLQLIVSVP